MTAHRPDTSLDNIRREIDSIDDAILDLIVQRFAATGRVAAAKMQDGSIAVSPFRPAREASLLRRLASKAHGQVSQQLMVRLWRVILSASTQAQAPVTVHAADGGGNNDLRLRIADYFCGMQIRQHQSPAEALNMLNARPGDLAVLPADSDWCSSFSGQAGTGAKVIGRLPDVPGASPALVFGHAETQETGDDETIILTRTQSPSQTGPAAKWKARVQDWTIIVLPGFVTEEDPLAMALLSTDPQARIAGRYPTPIEITP